MERFPVPGSSIEKPIKEDPQDDQNTSMGRADDTYQSVHRQSSRGAEDKCSPADHNGVTPADFEGLVDSVIRKNELVGEGAEKKVYAHPYDNEKLLAVYHEGNQRKAEDIRIRFYLGKVLHMLYPKSIPNIHSATSQPSTVTVEKVSESDGRGGGLRDVFSSIRKKLLRRRLSDLDIFFDEGGSNFLSDKDGNVYYIDELYPFHGFETTMKLRATVNKKLSGSDKESAMKYLDRMDALIKER